MTPNRSRRLLNYLVGIITFITVLAIASCTTSVTPQGDTGSLCLQLENAAKATVDIHVELLDDDGGPLAAAAADTIDIPVVTVTGDGVQYSTLQPIGAAAAAQSAAGSASDSSLALIRVPGYQLATGSLLCPPMIRITAQVTDGESAVLLSGDGSGTPGFDDGSIGPNGERYLIRGINYACGETIIIRVDDDGSGAGTGAGSAARGRVAVVATGNLSPFGPIDDGSSTGPDATTDGLPDGAVATAVDIRVDNRTATLALVDFSVGSSSGSTTSTGEDLQVNVAPESITEGSIVCGARLTIKARFPNTDRPAGESATAEYPDALIILTGDGTGSPGFDEASIGQSGERILIAGTHFTCGDTVSVLIADDSAVLTPQGFNALGLGAGTVQVAGEGEDVQPDDDVPVAEPDVTVSVNNTTAEFIRINVVNGLASLGKQSNVYVPPSAVTEGVMSCGEQYTISAYSLVPEALDGLLDQVLIVLQGDGTGTPGFDDGSVGATGQRLLLKDAHYACGDTIQIDVTDPGQPGFDEPDTLDTNGVKTGFQDLNGNGIQDAVPDRLGEGTVTVE